MSRPFRSVAVLGAGTMGAQIAGHLANAGLSVLLLDVTTKAASDGRDRLRTLKPDPLFQPDIAGLIQTGSFDDLPSTATADWIIEAIVEDLPVKQELLGRLEPYLGPQTIVSSNTSGIPLASIAGKRSESFKRRWLGTHFFNPPRYLRLVEIIPTPDTDPEVTARLAAFIDRRLGKGTVVANDTPGFIANRIGIFGALRLVEAAAGGEFTIEEIDAITGPAIGRPKSATFRTLDIAGIDIFHRVTDDLARRLTSTEERRQFEAPELIRKMVAAGLLGEKRGAGFYKKVIDINGGESKILTLDTSAVGAGTSASEPYVTNRPPKLPALEAVASAPVASRLRSLFVAKDRAGALLRRTLGPTLIYAARVAPEVASSIDDVDRAMRWGFGWELGPFETWDAIGIETVLDSCEVPDPPPLVRDLLASGRKQFRDAPLPPAQPGLLILQSARARSKVVRQNAGASLVDLDDGVLCVEFHSKMNALGGDAIEMLQAGVREAAANFSALVVGNDAEHFSAGANLMLLLLEAQEGNWDEVDLMVRSFQGATMALKTSPVPAVAAPGGLALGGGCEVCLHTDRVQAAAETYIGLVEVGVGLIPAGGGSKEMLLRAVDGTDAGGDTGQNVQSAFATMAFARVSTSGADARRLGYLRDVDGVTMNRERVLADAKDVALRRVREGYQPPTPRSVVPVGGADLLAVLSLGVHLAHRAGRISDHDALIGRKLAWILSGGDLPHRTTVSEQYLLDLEREAFLSLCGERKTLERIGYTLKTGKLLRN
ncbi:MAG TPA: 3-hydroxyacyl-CoA dehydrogenase NAD-binding domain-containing protein [Vicinamibacterales bacterium]|nr:3-hydroxyacyl-CoA dehydrogenase NAD-binding domain-containing protein [Vicinamibacterales bacterium]